MESNERGTCWSEHVCNFPSITLSCLRIRIVITNNLTAVPIINWAHHQHGQFRKTYLVCLIDCLIFNTPFNINTVQSQKLVHLLMLSASMENFLPFQLNLKLSPTSSFSLEESKICRLGKNQPFPKQTLLFTCLQYKFFENTMEKGEIPRHEQFLLYPQGFPQAWSTFCHFN